MSPTPVPVNHDTQPVCDQRFNALEQRIEKLEKAEWKGETDKINGRLDKFGDKIQEQSEKFARLTGWIAGATAIGGIFGGLASAFLQHFLK